MKLSFKVTEASKTVEPNLLPFEMVQSFINAKGTTEAVNLQEVFNEKYIYYSVGTGNNEKRHIVVPIVLFVGKNSESGKLQLLSCNNKCIVNECTEESAAIYENYDDCKKFVDKTNQISVIQSFIDTHAKYKDVFIKIVGDEIYWRGFADLNIKLANAKKELADL